MRFKIIWTISTHYILLIEFKIQIYYNLAYSVSVFYSLGISKEHYVHSLGSYTLCTFTSQRGTLCTPFSRCTWTPRSHIEPCNGRDIAISNLKIILKFNQNPTKKSKYETRHNQPEPEVKEKKYYISKQ